MGIGVHDEERGLAPLAGRAALAWSTVPARREDPRLLQEPQTVAALGAAGWQLPSEVQAELRLQVYDVRLEPGWLRRNVPGFCPTAPGRVEFIGGDFLTEPRPLRDDAKALDVQRLQRWCPEGPEPYHLVVLPRPHRAQWLARGRQQFAFEVAKTVISVLGIVPRDLCPFQWDAPAGVAGDGRAAG